MSRGFVVVNGERIELSSFRKKSLSLHDRGIKDISEIEGLKTLTNLDALYLYNNQISEIKGLETLTNLKILRLDNNQISEIKGLENLVKLEDLRLHNNQISEIKGLETLTNLKMLDLANNQISEIKGLETLTNLKKLNLAYNQISEIKGLETLTKLDDLMLDFNMDGLMRKLYSMYLEDKEVDTLIELGELIAVLPYRYRGGIKLVKFDKSIKLYDFDHYITVWYEDQHVVGITFSGLKAMFKNILESIVNFSKLRILILYETEAHPFPSSFKNLKNLEELEFLYFQEDNNGGPDQFVFPKIEFSKVFKDFINLKRIKIKGQFNVYFPPSFTNIPNLEELHLAYCTCTSNRSTYLKNSECDPNDMESWNENLSFSDLPDDLGKLISLKKLYLEEVRIKSIPSSITNLPILKELALCYAHSGTKIRPNDISVIFNITSLEKLNLSRFRLKSIPDSIGNLINLKELNLFDNFIKEIMPAEITNCQKLEKIDLAYNNFGNLEFTFLKKFQNLQYIRISQSFWNQSHLIPKELYNKKDLEIEVLK